MRLFIIIFSIALVFSNCKNSGSSASTDLEDLIFYKLDGSEIALGELKGKTVFLNFWATWCRPCVSEMPSIDEMAKLFKEQDVVFLAASYEDMDKVKSFASYYNYSFEFVKINEEFMLNYDIASLPTTWVIDKNGEVVWEEIGKLDWSEVSKVERLFNIANN